MDGFEAHLEETAGIDAALLARASDLARARGEPVLRVLVDLGALSGEDRARLAADYLGLPRLVPSDLPQAPVLPDRLPERFLRRARGLPLSEAGGELAFAVTDPFDDITLKAVRLAAGRPLRLRVCSEAEWEHAFEALYGAAAAGDTTLDRLAEAFGSGAAGETGGAEADAVEAAGEAPVIRVVKLLLDQAVRMGASDIHVEPFAAGLTIRARVDGLLRPLPGPPLRMAQAITARIKIMGRLNIAERRLPQDGRFSWPCDGREIDVRLSTVPTVWGESVVMRLLDKDRGVLDFAALGYRAGDIARLERLLEEPNGILLITGPTGSGKSTSLYAALGRLNHPGRKILSVEDPVEYRIEGINQIAVRPAIGLGFADLLRNVVRQDPDVIMVGETRDAETAEIAIRAALTGHLVLSSLHTNDAAGAVTRLRDLGVPAYLIASTLRAVIAQRLLRRLCPACGTMAAPDPAEASLIASALPGALLPPGPLRIGRATGCAACDGTGYRGRIGVFEVMEVSGDMRADLAAGAGEARLRQASAAAGGLSMAQDAVLKAMAGVTTLSEVARTLRVSG